MASTKYVMTIRLEGGTYSEQELLFDHMKDLILGFGYSFDLTDTCDFHELAVYGISDHDVACDLLISIRSAMATYRALYPSSSLTMPVGAYPDRSDEPLEDIHRS